MKRPNIVFITTDQQRGDCLGSDGHPVLETPYLDHMAEEGVRFTKAYTSVPSCVPTRAAMLTGMDQWNHGRLTMTGTDALEYPATLPGELAKAGYHTQGVGKMHHHPQRKLYGFHHLVLDESGRRIGNFVSDYHRWFDENKEGRYGYRDHSIGWNSWMARPSHLPEHLHPTHWTASEGVKFIERRDPTKPFFLWLSFARPHSPYDPPQVYYDMYIDNHDIPRPVIGDWTQPFNKKVDDVNAPYSRRIDTEIHRARAAYYGSITFIDHQIGRFLHEFQLYDPGAYRNTLFIFTSDHGDMLGDHHHWRKTYGYEGSARVPFIIRFPRGWEKPKVQVIDKPIEMRDVMPTILDAAGCSIPRHVDGASLLPLCRGAEIEWREFVQGEHTVSYGREWGNQWVTDGKEKYIWFHHTGRELFFDLTQDPMECRNLAADSSAKARVELWRSRLAEINEKRGDPRGQNGRLIPQPDGALRLSPNYDKWKALAAATVD